MDCPECSRITAEYQQLEQQYASAVNLLNAGNALRVEVPRQQHRAAGTPSTSDWTFGAVAWYRFGAATAKRYLETHVEYVPRPRQWFNHKTGGNAVVSRWR
jgi:hypothetical protein